MESCGILKVVGLLMALVAVPSLALVELTYNHNYVLEGDTVQITCSIPDYVEGEYVQWVKYAEDNWEMQIQLANQLGLEDDYSLLADHFAVGLIDEEVVQFTLTISNANVAYSGRYGCIKAGVSEPEEETVVVQVLASPTDITLFIDHNEISSDTDVELEGAKEVHVRCETSGGNPAPMLKLIGRNSDGVDMDLSSKLGEVASELVFTEGVVRGFEERTNTAVLESDLTLSYATLSNHNELRCVSQTEGVDDDPLESSKYIIQFEGHPPTINCHELNLIIDPYEHHFIVNCTVNADPAIHDYYLEFVRLGTNETVRLDGDDYFSSNLRMYQDDDKNDAFTSYVIISFDRVVPQMFRTYTLTAVNTKGSDHVDFTLTKDPDYREQGSGVAGQCSFVSIATLLLSVLATHWL